MMLLVVALTLRAADKSTAVFTLDHQMQQGCKERIISNLRYEKGVSNLNVSLPENTITITYNPDKTDPAVLLEAFSKIGFNAVLLSLNGEPVDGPQEAAASGDSCCGGQGGCCGGNSGSCCGGNSNK